MKVSIKNLGQIKKADIKINDLTIIAGGNNTGKTYITYAIYGLLEEWKKYLHLEESENFAKTLIKEGSLIIPIELLNKKKTNIINKISEEFSDNIHNIFGAGENQFPNTKISVSIEQNSPAFIDKISPVVQFGKNIKIEARYEKDKEVILSLITEDKKKLPPLFILSDGITFILSYILLKSSFPSPFILSAERQAISLFYKELDINKDKLIEQLQKVSGERGHFDPFELIEAYSSRYALPIKDNIFFTRDISKLKSSKSSLSFGEEILKTIKDMAGGYFKQVDKEIHFISTARKKGKFNIPLYLASSSARGLSDIYFYLKHKAQKGDILMIDEPESHLHPANQIYIARLLALCVNSGLKVFISTHSDYIIREFNNLIMLSNSFDGKEEF
ncbi:MAG: AAA family ATPase, partial [Deltaproteobacteria bacterium]|nr:AAA family ATPase [Deltaproteobacteria bacterium]